MEDKDLKDLENAPIEEENEVVDNTTEDEKEEDNVIEDTTEVEEPTEENKEKNTEEIKEESVENQEIVEEKDDNILDNDEFEDEFSNEESLSDQVKVLSPTTLVLKRFFRSKLSVFGLVTLVILFIFSFIGPLFSPWGVDQVDYTENISDYMWEETKFTGPDGEEYIVFDVTYDVKAINGFAAPSSTHLLGTDQNGLDIFTRLMYGGRISLTLGFVVVIIETLIGILMGGLAGYFGRWVDQVIMRIVDILNCLPTFPILLIASSLLDAFQIDHSIRIYYLMIILTAFGWSGMARLVRGQILGLRDQEFMLAAEATGISTRRKIFAHLIPNVMPQLIVSMTLGLGSVILTEASLSFLGMGMSYPAAAWGSMINSANSNPDILAKYFNIWGPPGFCIVLAILAFNFIGDGLRDAIDPKMKR